MAKTTATRRGLVLVLYSEGPLAIGALAFVLFPTRPLLLLGGILVSLVFGGLAGLAVWAGRREFGPDHARNVPRATLAFVLLLACMLLAFFQVTSVFPESLELRDLYGPWFFLGLALFADTAGVHLLLAPLLVGPQRRWLYATWGLALAAAAVYLVRGWSMLGDLIERSGGTAAVPAEATSYARDFVEAVVRDWALALLALRVGFWPALYRALVNVAEAEEDAARRLREAGAAT